MHFASCAHAAHSRGADAGAGGAPVSISGKGGTGARSAAGQGYGRKGVPLLLCKLLNWGAASWGSRMKRALLTQFDNGGVGAASRNHGCMFVVTSVLQPEGQPMPRRMLTDDHALACMHVIWAVMGRAVMGRAVMGRAGWAAEATKSSCPGMSELMTATMHVRTRAHVCSCTHELMHLCAHTITSACTCEL